LTFFLVPLRPPCRSLLPYTRSSDLDQLRHGGINQLFHAHHAGMTVFMGVPAHKGFVFGGNANEARPLLGKAFGHQAAQSESAGRSEEHTSELQSRENLVCRLLLEK